jgi:Ca2+-binding RTX toxin-like protein
MDVNLAKGTATGEGSDRLKSIENVNGSSYSDLIVGDSGPNTFFGGKGNDRLYGLAGHDQLIGDGLGLNPGNDIIDGGRGFDEVSFLPRFHKVRVSLARGMATGQGKDRLRSIESVIGSQYADVIVGDSGPNRIDGGAGNDRLYGLAGGDRLIGNSGSDHADGGPGRDVCRVETMVNCP